MTVEELLRLSAPSSTSDPTCKTKLGENSWVVRCHPCCLTELALLCVDCFKRGNHIAEGHEYVVIRSSEGSVCDCGDKDYLLDGGHCDAHSPDDRLANPCATLPVSIEQPLRIVIRMILGSIASSDLMSSPLDQRVMSLLGYLQNISLASYPAAFIVGQEFAGHLLDSTNSRLPFTKIDPKSLYPTMTMMPTPIIPLVFQYPSFCLSSAALITILITAAPFRQCFSHSVIEQYTTSDHANIGALDDTRYGLLLSAISFQASLAFTTHPDPSKNLIYLIINRIRTFFGMVANDPQKDFNSQFISSNNITILQSLVDTLQVIQDFSPVHRELVQPSEYPIPYVVLMACIDEANVTPTLRETRPDYLKEVPVMCHKFNIPEERDVEIIETLVVNTRCLPMTIKSCKHLMHQDCRDSYSENGAFQCPLCHSIANTLLPIDFEPSDDSVKLQEAFYRKFLSISFESYRTLVWRDHVIIPLLFASIESLEILSRPSTFMSDTSFTVVNESEFQSQLTNIRAIYHTIKYIISRRTHELIDEYFVNYNPLWFDPMLTLIFAIYSRSNTNHQTLINTTFQQFITISIEHLIDQAVHDARVHVIRYKQEIIYENIYFDRLHRPATKPGPHLTLSKQAYRQLYINWLKGTYA
eukprot:gene6586-7644_t